MYSAFWTEWMLQLTISSSLLRVYCGGDSTLLAQQQQVELGTKKKCNIWYGLLALNIPPCTVLSRCRQLGSVCVGGGWCVLVVVGCPCLWL